MTGILSMDDMFTLTTPIIDGTKYKHIISKINNNYANLKLYGGLTHNYNLNKDTVIKDLEYNKKIGYNLRGEVKKILTKRGKTFLLIANAGGGKTYVMLDVSAELVEENKANNVVYILAVPNTSQSNQNEISEDLVMFGFDSIVGKNSKIKKEDKSISEKIKEGARKFSCVYDKALEVVEEAKRLGLEVVLIVDETHKLIYDTYREAALEGMDEAIKVSDMVVMMTATPDVCKHYYQYDEIYNLVDKEVQNNIEKFRILYSNNWKITLRKELKRLKALNKIALVKISSKEEIKAEKKALEKLGYLVEVATSNEKGSDLFKDIETTGTIGDDVDIILCTSVIEAGISLKDKSLVPIEIVRGSRDFNTDNTTQFFARPRIKVSEGIMIVKNYNEDILKEIVEFEEELNNPKNTGKVVRPKTKKIYPIDKTIEQVKKQATTYYKTLEATLNKKLKGEYLEVVKEHMIGEIYRVDRTGSVKIDLEAMKLHVNTKDVIKEAYRRRDARILEIAPLMLYSQFEGRIFYDSIELDADLNGNVEDEVLNNIKESKEEKKIAQELKDLKEKQFRDWLASGEKDIYKVLEALHENKLNRTAMKNYDVTITLRELIEFRDTSLYELMKVCYREFSIGQVVKIVTAKYKECNEYITKTDIRRIYEAKHAMGQVKVGYYENSDMKNDIIYEMINTLKTNNNSTAPVQFNLTEYIKTVVYSELVKKGCKGYSSKKVKEAIRQINKEHGKYVSWREYSKEDIKKLESAISSRSKDKVVNDIGMLYELGKRNKSGKEYLVINNVKITFSLDETLGKVTSSK